MLMLGLGTGLVKSSRFDSEGCDIVGLRIDERSPILRNSGMTSRSFRLPHRLLIE
jgi:hypothetical protein